MKHFGGIQLAEGNEERKYTMDSPNEDDLQKHKDYKDHYDFHTQIKRCIKKMEQQEKSSSASATGKE